MVDILCMKTKVCLLHDSYNNNKKNIGLCCKEPEDNPLLPNVLAIILSRAVVNKYVQETRPSATLSPTKGDGIHTLRCRPVVAANFLDR